MEEFICSCGRTVLTDKKLHVCSRFIHKKPYISKVGEIFNNCLVLKEYWKDGTRYYKCKCSCGNEFDEIAINVERGHSVTCGFHYKELDADSLFKKRYDCMISRCSRNNPNYKDVKIDERWQNFDNFKKDMYNSFIEHLNKHGRNDTTLDRINPFKNYSPDNCRWATKREQSRNRRITPKFGNKTIFEISEESNIPVTVLYSFYERKKSLKEAIDYWNLMSQEIIYNGETYTYYDFCKSFGLSLHSMHVRLSKNCSKDKILTILLAQIGKVIYNGTEMDISECASLLKIPENILSKRLRSGMPLEKAAKPNCYIIDGIHYTLKEIAEKIKLDVRDLSYYVKGKDSIEEDIKRAIQNEFVTYNNKTYTIRELADKHMIRVSRLRQLIAKMPIEDALKITDYCHKDFKLKYNNEEMTLKEASSKYNIPLGLLRERIWKGWPIEKALTQPVKK